MIKIVAICLVLVTVTRAHADTPADAKAAMHDYFDGEKTGGYVLVGMGVVGVGAGLWLRTQHCKIRQGAAYPALVVGGLQIAAGIYVNIASRDRIDKFNDEIDRDGQAWVLRERDRMDGVHTQFTVLKIVELGLIAGGVTAAYIAYQKGRPKLQGIAIGIAVEAAMTLGFDIWASSRANGYRDDLAGLDLASPRVMLPALTF